MRDRTLGCTLILAAAVILIGAMLPDTASAALPRYKVIDLGTLGGNNGKGNEVNSSNQVAGSDNLASGSSRAFFYDTVMHDLGVKSGDTLSYGYGLNDSGQVAGYSKSGSTSQEHAFVTVGGTMYFMGFSATGYSEAYDVNNVGNVAGSYKSGSFWKGYVWKPSSPNGTTGSSVEIGTLGGNDSYGYSINTNGAIAGKARQADSKWRAMKWTPTTPNGTTGSMVSLGGLVAGAYGSEAWDLNGLGYAVGNSYIGTLPTSDIRPFLYDTAIHELGVLAGHNRGRAWGINDSGIAVGISSFFNVTESDKRGTIWENGSTYDVNTLLQDSPNWVVQEAFDISNNGYIVGTATNGSGQSRAVLLQPVPEPGSIAAVAVGLVGLVLTTVRRRNS